MMHLLILISIIFYGNHVSAQESDERCELRNQTCQVNALVNLALVRGKTGVPSLDIGPIDPQKLEPATQNVMGIYNLTLHEGECLGIIETCRLVSFSMDIDNFRRIVEFNCPQIRIQGRYTLETNPIYYAMGNVNGCGNLSIVLEDWYFYFENSFHFEERNNTIYMKVDEKEGVYKTSVTNATFMADSIKLDEEDITEKVLCFLNNNGPGVFNTFGSTIKELAKEYYDRFYRIYFRGTPATALYLDDLTQYLNKCS